MKSALVAFLAVVALAWAHELLSPGHVAAGAMAWAIYLEGLFLSGLFSIALMSLAMVLATRPAWLERPLGGMDRIYRLHKWSGIWAVIFAATHWLLEMSDDLFEGLSRHGSRIDEDELSAFPEPLRDLGEELGEFVIYLLLGMLLLSLWRQFSYRLWRPLHRAMPVLYLLLVFHAVVLAPAGYWSQPVGLLMALLFTAGGAASVLSLTGRIGRRRRSSGTVVAVENPSPEIIEVTCRLDEKWRGHRAGQFAFVTFDRFEGHHPFTIASADRGDGTLTFAIKALGDYTGKLPQRVKSGDAVQVEGPYGRFQLKRANLRARQIWIAGGIGVTPFIAWLESLQGEAGKGVEADLHYSVSDRQRDPFVARLQALCEGLPGVRLHLHDRESGRLSTEALLAESANAGRTEVWYCGPQGLANSLRQEMKKCWPGRLNFHQEAFQMR
ncbi:MAG: ferric reductase-like transmembrane domain-containing protein [Gammaproteobacteria bacterium]|nr:ferric reductase-like transmembrane domain-containing protein [Gammaproteobacteria bacterium]MCW8958029.1 ferric reductase-like transmembrane domain-containing protein [Gammaproteobacteria bacterium]MCW8974057.1 ferric reductase-like transmembrane domain-containing protein [Gammaproteobacteria bacterium]MCW8993895.1 ferric reductase-like transmembrane domain-containing protein [Gammaproteobacteria bacterium]